MRQALNSLLGIAALSVAATSGFAESAYPASPSHNWSGFYLGLNAGGNWDAAHATTTVAPTGPTSFFIACAVCVTAIAGLGDQTFHTGELTGGVQGGYNWQVGNFVAGIELDAEPFRNSGSITASQPFPVAPANTQTISSSFNSQWLFSVRPRLGVATGNFLFYGTGGLAVTRLNTAWTYSTDFNAPCDCESASVTSIKERFIFGGGIENALPGNWLIGVEYLHVNFGTIVAASNNFMVPGGINWTDTFNHSISLTTNTVRVRLNKQF